MRFRRVSIKDVLPQTLNEWEKSRLTIHSSIETLEKLDNRKETQELLSKFNTLFKAYEDIGGTNHLYPKKQQK